MLVIQRKIRANQERNLVVERYLGLSIAVVGLQARWRGVMVTGQWSGRSGERRGKQLPGYRPG